MEVKQNKFIKFLSGRGFYLVLAACMVAIGAAAWTAWAAIDGSDTAESIPESSDVTSSLPENSESVQTENESEPYSSSEESSSVSQKPADTVAINFIYPLTGNTVKEFSGEELVYSSTYSDMRLHTGLDIAGEPGEEIVSCGNGVVTVTEYDPAFGNCVTVDHGNGITARYCGLTGDIAVTEGDRVSAGVLLGFLGEIPGECADESHLHLEFYKNGEETDPADIIG